ncbi:cysteine/glutathione ABC transporter permease/ATP-binding protein CydD [Shewanella sp. D64]|uniref:heme ABC transporter permease/ATP-binding protein CydD n=1 Tax=unclassified Shewanella TaxID=196818 RepID=UPI0022BA5ACF|nr:MULTISPECIES: cysteine/glutathione ABC transporter permease/ATP-binding protein CydD [unclassified Shewanella]MEC4728053.1 cysteine/glutathione ABC transporter permease/ATP-binding protein CydD [Shewanella sp. D64]MEC4738189.1 cysteine/glutathione ABC transporter permease/ATP-binding protein CydD [Shewanella sp. E94]WBJ96303.1 cysteine/glutathione ABC transporter permease/ATP-binding protein CydD [Shewanella sp. MTB7]
MEKSLEKVQTSWLKQQKGACGFYLNLTVLFGLLTGLALVVQAYFIATILNGVIMLELPRSQFTQEFFALLGLIAVRALLAFARERASFEAGKRLRCHIRSLVLDKLNELGPAFVKGKPVGSWASIVLEQVEDLHDFYARYLPQVLLAGFIPLTILVVVFPINWAAGVILLATAPLIPMFMVLVGMGAADANRKNFSALAKLSGHFMDRLKGLSTLKLFNRGNAEAKEIESASEEFRERTMSVLRMAFLSSAVLEFFAAVSIAVLAVYFGFSYLDHLNFGHYGAELTLFIGLFVLILAPEFYQPLRDMGTHYHAKAQAIGAAEELMALLNYKLDNGDITQEGAKFGEAALGDVSLGLAIEAKELSVTSLDGVSLLGPISFTLKAGEHLAIVGPSGAGKTSLLNALLGFLPYKGSLKVNGIELGQLDKVIWRRHLAWLGQEPQLFHGTIRDNVAMADPLMSDELVRQYLAQAKVLDFVEQQRKGLDYKVGEQASTLSVGQAQRIALARALGQNAQLFLLDEPTASLDSHSEQAVQQALKEAMAKASCLMVTHRLDQLHQMDNILVLDNGTIAEQGSFEQLNCGQGLFKQMQQEAVDYVTCLDEVIS